MTRQRKRKQPPVRSRRAMESALSKVKKRITADGDETTVRMAQLAELVLLWCLRVSGPYDSVRHPDIEVVTMAAVLTGTGLIARSLSRKAAP